MKKLLIISPHFPPINAPDMQRVRLALPYLRAHGWEPTVLAIAPESIEGAVMDKHLLDTYPADIRVIRVNGLPSRFTRWAGIGNLWWRCGRALTNAGDQLLKNEKFDLAFISTTQFSAFQLGPRWLHRHGLPYVLDYQDPWINDYYHLTGVSPPGGRIKFALSQWEAARIEPVALREAAGIVSVSHSYGAMLADHYPWFPANRLKLLPFGASQADFEALGKYRPAKPLIDFEDGCFHHVYAGRCGPDMTFALTVLFRAFKRFRETHPEQAAKMRFNFIGTDYSPPPLGRDWVIPIAKTEGVLDVVREQRYRVPYFDSLYYLRNADALVAVGSNDPTYSASKFFPYVLARRPLLMIFHRDSPVLRFALNVGAGIAHGFTGPEDIAPLAEEISRRWFIEGGCNKYVPFIDSAFEPFSAARMVDGLAAVFEDALKRRPAGL
ncbi:MAG: glycosyltransferase [Opitutaceae bacterium]|jgi:hypothetical protein